MDSSLFACSDVELGLEKAVGHLNIKIGYAVLSFINWLYGSRLL